MQTLVPQLLQAVQQLQQMQQTQLAQQVSMQQAQESQVSQLREQLSAEVDAVRLRAAKERQADLVERDQLVAHAASRDQAERDELRRSCSALQAEVQTLRSAEGSGKRSTTPATPSAHTPMISCAQSVNDGSSASCSSAAVTPAPARRVSLAEQEAKATSTPLTSSSLPLKYEVKVPHAPLSALDAGKARKSYVGPSGWVYQGRSFDRFLPHQQPRKYLIKLIESPLFDPLILVTIMANCATMAWSSPLDPSGTWKQAVLYILEWVYLLIFTFEMSAKMLSYGLLTPGTGYLRDAWCQLDFVVVSLAWLPILIPSMGNMSAIRGVRALRPLRALKRVPGMPVLVSSILKSMPALLDVAVLAGFVFFVFGIVGMNLFKGVLRERCADPALLALQEAGRRALRGGGGGGGGGGEDLAGLDSGTLCHANPGVCEAEGMVCHYFGTNPEATTSFDSTLMAMIPILQAVTFDTWTDPMVAVMGAYSPWACVYFVAVAVLGGLFLVNLFLAAIFDEFMRTQEANAVEKALEASAVQKAAHSGRPDRQPDPAGAGEEAEARLLPADASGSSDSAADSGSEVGGGLIPPLGRFMNSVPVGNVSTVLVVLNLGVMCMPYVGQPAWWASLTETLGDGITYVFIVEMGLKLLGMGWMPYWSDTWNQLDGAIVTMSMVEIAITLLLADTGVNISFLRMLRLLRLLRLLKAWPGLYHVVKSFVSAVPQICNLFVLMFLLMFIFALLGMQTFGGTGMSADSRWHFDYFYPAMLAVFGVFTGGWVDLFQACVGVSSVGTALLFFVPAIVVGFFIIMNLFIAILLEAFAHDEDEDDEGEGDEREGEEAGGEGGGEGKGAETAESVAAVVPEAEAVANPPNDPPGSPGFENDGGPRGDALVGMSLDRFGPESEFRLTCHAISSHRWFDKVIIALIVASSVGQHVYRAALRVPLLARYPGRVDARPRGWAALSTPEKRLSRPEPSGSSRCGHQRVPTRSLPSALSHLSAGLPSHRFAAARRGVAHRSLAGAPQRNLHLVLRG